MTTFGGGTDYWFENRFIHHRVKNMLLRGWLLKTYNDGKLLKGRIKTAEKGRENDNIDILNPVGFVAHIAPGDKVEAFSADIGGDPTRRVILSIIGDREQHPVPDENEVFMYAPGDRAVHTRIKKERNQQERSNDNSGRTKESGREVGVHTDAKDLNTSSTTKASTRFNADQGIGAQTSAGSFTVRAAENTQFEAAQHIRKGETHREGTMYIEGVVHAGDVFAGGGTSIQSSGGTRFVGQLQGWMQKWTASGKQGQTSLLDTAAKVASLLGQFTAFQGQQQQQNQQNDQQIQQMMQLIEQLSQRIAALGG